MEISLNSFSLNQHFVRSLGAPVRAWAEPHAERGAVTWTPFMRTILRKNQTNLIEWLGMVLSDRTTRSLYRSIDTNLCKLIKCYRDVFIYCTCIDVNMTLNNINRYMLQTLISLHAGVRFIGLSICHANKLRQCHCKLFILGWFQLIIKSGGWSDSTILGDSFLKVGTSTKVTFTALHWLKPLNLQNTYSCK